jgi:hypothetical protein
MAAPAAYLSGEGAKSKRLDVMIRTLVFAPLVAATVLAVSPAMAQTTHQRDRAQTQQPYRQGAPGWTRSDPSLGYFPNLDRARALGRCVEDLGYGRFEYCD